MTGRALIDIRRRKFRRRKFRRARGYEKDSYFHEHFADEKVSNRLPRRPRLQIEGLSGTPGWPIDLVPALDTAGNVVPDTWVLPQVRNPKGEWESRYGSTSAIRKRVKQHGLKARVLSV